MLNIFLEFLEALQNPKGLQNIVSSFEKHSSNPEVANHFSRISRSPTKSQKLQNIFKHFTNIPVLPEFAKHFSRIYKSPTKSPKLHDIVSSIYKHSSTS